MPHSNGSTGGWKLKLKPVSEEEKNSGCIVYYQFGQLGMASHERSTLLLMMKLIEQPMFAELRTKQQLGYVVHSGAYLSGLGHDEVAGSYIVILSKSQPPPSLQKAIDAYVVQADEVIAKLTNDEFLTSRTALVTRFREPDRTLAEASDRRWRPIVAEHYDWNARANSADAIEKVTQEDTIALAKRLVAMPRIAVHTPLVRASIWRRLATRMGWRPKRSASMAGRTGGVRGRSGRSGIARPWYDVGARDGALS